MSATQLFQISAKLGPTKGIAATQPGAVGRPARTAASVSLRIRLTSSALGVAITSGSTTITAVSVTISPAAGVRRRCRCARSHSNTGQVVNARIAAQSSDDMNGYSTMTQPMPMPPSSRAINTRSAVILPPSANDWSFLSPSP